jgi:hypothetical protein
MLNSQFIQEHAEHLALKLQKEAPASIEEQIKLAWALIYSSSPTKDECDSSLAFIKEQTSSFSKSVAKKESNPELQSLTAFCQGLLISNRFLYVD